MEDGITNDAGSFESPDVDLSILEQSGVPSASGGAAQGTESPSAKIQIDPRYSNLPQLEAQLRSIQSHYDKMYSEHEKLIAQMAEKDSLVEILNDLVENDDAFYALVNQKKPELLKNSYNSAIANAKAELAKEFGEDYRPSLSKEEAEWEDPDGKDARYWRRREELLKKANSAQQYSKFSSLKEYIDKLREQRKSEAESYQKEIADAKAKFNMTDGEIEATTKWAESLKFEHIVQIKRFLQRFPKAPGNIPGQQTSAPQYNSSLRQQFIDSLKVK